MGKGQQKGRRGGAPEVIELDTRIVDVARVAKVIQGGRRFAFRALIVVGDRRGHVGLGTGKARTVQDAIRKATERARASMRKVEMLGTTIPHQVIYKFGSAKVMLKPASPGTGVIAGGGVRAVLEAAGIRDVLTKSLGSQNSMNNTYATFYGLMQLKNIEAEAAARGKRVEDVQPFWVRNYVADEP
ncbi:MAG: 30S ribosomal protein S5 [Anaerolineae bacterium]|nr:30S ribosomal protein S5 [Thermoflexales bacterium]MDW8395555.1 30S ribosomal protein S5 [Anaerolineae bacterium]